MLKSIRAVVCDSITKRFFVRQVLWPNIFSVLFCRTINFIYIYIYLQENIWRKSFKISAKLQNLQLLHYSCLQHQGVYNYQITVARNITESTTITSQLSAILRSLQLSHHSCPQNYGVYNYQITVVRNIKDYPTVIW